jgi:hypothetical protein
MLNIRQILVGTRDGIPKRPLYLGDGAVRMGHSTI